MDNLQERFDAYKAEYLPGMTAGLTRAYDFVQSLRETEFRYFQTEHNGKQVFIRLLDEGNKAITIHFNSLSNFTVEVTDVVQSLILFSKVISEEEFNAILQQVVARITTN